MANRKLTLFEAAAVLSGTIIGAGVLAIPYAVARVGWTAGTLYLIVLGVLLLGLNLMLGEIVLRTSSPLQIPGLAGRYLGRVGKYLSSAVVLSGAYGALLAYIIGEGEVLAALFGGEPYLWSLFFAAFGAVLVFFGLRLIKRADLFLIFLISTVVISIVLLSTPHLSFANLAGFNRQNWLLPYGVILFALMGVGAVPQMEEVLPKEQGALRKAIFLGSLFPVLLYFLFMTAVVGVTGAATTPVATIGLGRAAGPLALIFGNLFAMFSMGTAFLNGSLAVKRQFEWDYRLNHAPAWLLTIGVPLLLFLGGARNFIGVIEFVGSIFGSLGAIIIILIYWQARKRGDILVRRYAVHHALLLSILLILVFALGAIYSLRHNLAR